MKNLVKFVYEQNFLSGKRRILEKELEMPYGAIPKEGTLITNPKVFFDGAEGLPKILRVTTPIEAEWKADGFEYTIRLMC